MGAYREPAWGRATRWLRQHDRTARGAAAGVALAILVLAVGLVRVERERSVAEGALAAERVSLRAALRAGHLSFTAADNALADRDGTDADRRRLLDEYLAHTRGLLDRYRDDPDARLEVATAWCRVGFSHDRAGRWAEALAALDQAAPLLAGTDPAASPETWALLVRSHTLSAWLLNRLGRVSEAEDRLAQADQRVQTAQGVLPAPELDRLSGEYLTIRGMTAPDPAAGGTFLTSAAGRFDHAAAGPAPGPQDRPQAAFARLVAAVRFRDAGRPDDAQPALTRSREDYDRLLAERPSSRDFRQRAAACANLEGLLRADAGDHAGGVGWYERAVGMRRALVAANPTALDLRMELATSLSNYGKALRLSGRAADAVTPAREACAFAGAVFREQPGVVHYRASAGLYRVRAGQVGVEVGKWDEAEANFRAALDLLAPLVAGREVENAHRRTAAEAGVGLGLCHVGRGNWRAAWTAWATAEPSGPPPLGSK